MDEDSFRLVFEDWSFLALDFGLTASLVEIWGPETDTYIAYLQAILDLNPDVKEAVQALKRKQAEVDAYLAQAGRTICRRNRRSFCAGCISVSRHKPIMI